MERVFLFDGKGYTLNQMLDSNEHDLGFCEWAKTASSGDIFDGCMCIGLQKRYPQCSLNGNWSVSAPKGVFA